jgi:hypothetical protein
MNMTGKPTKVSNALALRTLRLKRACGLPVMLN